MLDLTQIGKAIRSEGGLSRRLLLAYGAALAAIPTLGLRADDQPKRNIKFKSDPFSLGVASGDPTDDSVVIWTRLAPKPLDEDGGMPHDSVEVAWVVADDEKLKNVIRSGKAVASPKLGHSVHVEVEGLKPDHWYWYQFRCGDASSPVGHTRTMPAAAVMPERLRFAFASCQNYEDGFYTAYQHMAKDDLDLVFHLGDYIYEYGAHNKGVRKHVRTKEIKSLDDYRIRHCQYRSDPHLHHMHARCPWVVTWDDHEVEGNYANDTPKKKGPSPAEFLERRAHAYQAYYEMMPLRPASIPRGPFLKLYRTVSFGKLASFQVLDTRQYRTNQPNGDERSDLNPAALDPRNTILGAPQAEWLTAALLRSTATWNVLAQQVMMAMVDHQPGKDRKYSMDAWTGYANERMRLVHFLGERIKNPVVLTGDVHANYVNELRVDDRKLETPVVATEFIGTSISTSGDGGDGGKEHEAMLTENPFVKFHNHQRGYVRCTVTRDAWRSDYRVLDAVTKPGGKISTRASFIVAAGKPGAVKA